MEEQVRGKGLLGSSGGALAWFVLRVLLFAWSLLIVWRLTEVGLVASAMLAALLPWTVRVHRAVTRGTRLKRNWRVNFRFSGIGVAVGLAILALKLGSMPIGPRAGVITLVGAVVLGFGVPSLGWSMASRARRSVGPSALAARGNVVLGVSVLVAAVAVAVAVPSEPAADLDDPCTRVVSRPDPEFGSSTRDVDLGVGKEITDAIAVLGAGAYRLEATSDLIDVVFGGCEGKVVLYAEGHPLGSPAGAAAAALVIFGMTGLLFPALRRAVRTNVPAVSTREELRA